MFEHKVYKQFITSFIWNLSINKTKINKSDKQIILQIIKYLLNKPICIAPNNEIKNCKR